MTDGEGLIPKTGDLIHDFVLKSIERNRWLETGLQDMHGRLPISIAARQIRSKRSALVISCKLCQQQIKLAACIHNTYAHVHSSISSSTTMTMSSSTSDVGANALPLGKYLASTGLPSFILSSVLK